MFKLYLLNLWSSHGDIHAWIVPDCVVIYCSPVFGRGMESALKPSCAGRIVSTMPFPTPILCKDKQICYKTSSCITILLYLAFTVFTLQWMYIDINTRKYIYLKSSRNRSTDRSPLTYFSYIFLHLRFILTHIYCHVWVLGVLLQPYSSLHSVAVIPAMTKPDTNSRFGNSQKRNRGFQARRASSAG